ncbi:hypothetical protein AeMF1_005992 [Aphanomyces euteiches]|nr:hypothetical protein AeMF1_006816 [Aphanomyces euteiches]KAH9122901.1 hypothetical protein AeMF1_005992 [Aphanomyces euteiches]KAH9163844.1 hypothetical protein AeNC1_018747 [Aphanomyces euteiches]KAH9166292.1 hypothetical protein AeNC1_018368 [Aphanomyces euteiches]
MEEQRRSGHDIQNPPYDPQRAKEAEDAWTRGMPPANHPIPGGGWAHIAEYLRDASDPHEENDLHSMTDF